MDRPISVQNVNGNVTVTIVEGNNNQTQVSIGDFIEKTNRECGLRLIYEDDLKKNSNTTSNFNDWLKGFSFDLRSVYHKREYRREKVIDNIKKKLEEKQRLLILGESGTSKTILLMEILCDYLKRGFFKKGYKILHNLDPTTTGEIKNLEYLENTLLLLVKDGNNVIVIVDNVHNKSISTIFSLIQKMNNDHENKLSKIRFLLSARQPEFGWAMDRGIFDSDTIERIDLLFDDDKRYSIPYFTEDEVKGFIDKYKEYLHPTKRNKPVEENAQEIFKDTKGHPIMVRFSIIQDGLRTHVKRMYTDYLLQNNSPNTERIKSVITCSLYHISSIPLTEDELFNKLSLEDPSLQIINTMIKRTGNVWTTIHPRWDLELFKYMFSLNEADRRNIQKAFSSVLNKILDIQTGSFNQLLILNTLYKTIMVEQFVDIKFIQEMIKIDDIEKKLDNSYFKVLFFATIIGLAFEKLKDYNHAIAYYDKAIEIDPQYAFAYNNKGVALSNLGRNEEAIASYDKAIELDPQNAEAYNNKGIILSNLGKREEAIECFDKALYIDPQNTLAYYNKGNTLSALGKREEAIECFDKAIEIHPQNTLAYLSKGNALANIGRNEEAIECYDDVIRMNSQCADVYYNKGVALSNLGRNEEAIANYDKAIGINRQYVEAYNNKGMTLYDLGRYQDAINCYDKAIMINSQYVTAHYNKGTALSDLGRKEEAIECFNKAIEIDPQDAGSYVYKGTILSDLGRKEEAIECFNKALYIDPLNSLAHYNKGNALLALGRYENDY